MKPFRVAVCISGQSRTWKTAVENILNYFDIKINNNTKQRVKVDFFIHTWDINSYRETNVTQREESTIYPLDDNDRLEIENAFNPVLMEFEHFEQSRFTNVWSPLFYSFMKSVFLKRKYEIENEFVYDLVIKGRFDLNFPLDMDYKFGVMTNKFYIHPTEPFVAYASSSYLPRFTKEFNYVSFDDVFFYADSPTMDIIAQAYRWQHRIIYNDFIKLSSFEIMDGPEFYYGPGTTLYKHLVNWNIHPKGEHTTNYYLVRKEAEERNLHSIKDWEEIREISMNWYGPSFGKI
jgi:hypothetical protein